MKIKEKIKSNRIIYIYVLIILSLSFFITSFTRYENDYFWHIKVGKYMVEHKTILTHDIFSWIISGKYWISHEWLFEVFIYKLQVLFSNYHRYIYTFSSVTTLLFTLFICNKKGVFKNKLFSLIWITLSIIMIPFIHVRPHLLSYIFLALTIYILYDLYNNENERKIYFLPLITILWVNIHGGSSNLSYLLCIVFMIAGLFNFSYGKIESRRISKKQIIKYSIVCIISIMCISINPHGIRMLFYPYENMADSTMLSNISEWHPTDLSNILHYSYVILILFIFVPLLISNKKIRFIDLLLFLISVFLGMKSTRFWPYTYIISTFYIFYYIEKKNNKYVIITYIYATILFTILTINNIINFNYNLNKKIVDDKEISYLKKHKPKRLYNYYNYGGYLIYNDINVFVDGRADLYSKYNFDDYIDISDLNYNYDKLIDKYKFDYFLIPVKSGLDTYLSNNKKYKIVLKNKKSVIYKKI